MGVIQIRNRTERLGNLGGVRQTDVDIGASAALKGVYQAKEAQRDANWNAGMNVLQGAGKALKAGYGAYMDFRERRDKEASDRYVARYQQEMDEYNNGSVNEMGARIPGAMEVDFDDPGGWIKGNVDFRDGKHQQLKKDLNMSDRAMEIARRRLAGYDLHMQNQWQRRAEGVVDARRKGDANEALVRASTALSDSLRDEDPNGAATVATWQEWNGALERALDASHVVSEGDRAAFRRKNALAMIEVCHASNLKRIAGGCEGQPEEVVRKRFQDYEDQLKLNGIDAIVPQGGSIRNAKGEEIANFIRDYTKGADIVSLRKAAVSDTRRASAASLNAARAAAAEQVRAKAAEDAKFDDEIAKGMDKFMEEHPLSPPGGEDAASYMDAYHQASEANYRAIADRYAQRGNARKATTFRRMADRAAALRENAARRALGTFMEGNAAETERRRQGHSPRTGHTAAYDSLLQRIALGTKDDMGRDVSMTAWQIEDAANEAFANGTITEEERVDLMKRRAARLDKDGEAFVRMARESIGTICPDAFDWDADANAVVARSGGAGKKAYGPRSYSGIMFRGDDNRRVLVSEAAKALDITFLWMQKYHKGNDEGIRYFNDLMQGAKQTYNRQTIADTIEAAGDALKNQR